MNKHLYCSFAVLLLTCATAYAGGDERFPYQPVGAPADPKVSVHWNRYHDYAETAELLRAIVAEHKNLARLESLGKSHGGRDIWLLTLCNPETGNPESKPAFWIDGGIHGNEIQGVEVALYTAWYLLEMYGRNDFVTRLLDERTFYIVPMLSPDARDGHMHGPASTHSPRSGIRPVDDDGDGLVDEDPFNDLDGDGHITQMRIGDPNGRYISHPKYPNVMIRAEPDEPGKYRMLGTEGFDDDGDGRINEDGPGRYDPNRDWPWQWQPAYIQTGAGPYPLWLGPNRAAADFILGHPNIAAAQSYHNAAGMILRGPSQKSQKWDRADIAVFDALAKRGEEMLPGYKYVIMADDLYEGYGVEVDWLYSMRGLFAFTNELFSPESFFHKSSPGQFFASEETRAKFDRLLLFGEGTVPWHEVDHPQYGAIEVGGMKKNWGRQPPSFMLEEECHRNMAFSLYHADQMPLVRIDRAEVKPLDQGIWQVTAVLANSRLMPTRNAIDRERGITCPDLAEIEGKNLSVVAGLWSDDLFFLDAEEQAKEPERLKIAAIPGMGAVYVRWIVKGSGPCTIRVRSQRGGMVDTTLDCGKP